MVYWNNMSIFISINEADEVFWTIVFGVGGNDKWYSMLDYLLVTNFINVFLIAIQIWQKHNFAFIQIRMDLSVQFLHMT